jgi:hypothetical protein
MTMTEAAAEVDERYARRRVLGRTLTDLNELDGAWRQ